MRILVCGSRSITDERAVERILSYHISTKDTVIHGGCKSGVDAIADAFAKRRFNQVVVFPADWDKHGKAAGPIRNKQMIDEGEPTEVVAIWDGYSTGTKGTIDLSLAARVDTSVYFL